MDSIADFIIQIKNAGDSKKETVTLPYSKLRKSIGDVLEKEGYLKVQVKKGKKANKCLEVKLLYDGKNSRVRGVTRVSKPSKRIYVNSHDLAPVKNGLGKLVISTSKGILTGQQAKKEKVGGEALFMIW